MSFVVQFRNRAPCATSILVGKLRKVRGKGAPAGPALLTGEREGGDSDRYFRFVKEYTIDVIFSGRVSSRQPLQGFFSVFLFEMEIVRHFFSKGHKEFTLDDMAGLPRTPPPCPSDDCTCLADAALRNMIQRAQLPEMTEMCFKKSWWEIMERAIQNDDATSKFWLNLVDVTCGMDADKPGNFSFNGFVQEVFGYLDLWQTDALNPLSSARMGQARERCLQIKRHLLHPAIVQRYASMFSMGFDRARNALEEAQLQPYVVTGPLSGLRGFVTPLGVALNMSVIMASDCELVALLAHELGHYLVRRKNGVFDLHFHTPAKDMTGPPEGLDVTAEIPEVAEALLLESGCAAEVAIMGALLDLPPKTERNAEDVAGVDELVRGNLQVGELPLLNPFPPALQCYRADLTSRLCCGAFMFRHVPQTQVSCFLF